MKSRPMDKGFGARWQRFRSADAGGVIAPVAIMLPILLGASGLAVDVGVWYANKRGAQAAADAAARAGALEAARGQSDDVIRAAALDDASRNGYTEAAGDVVAVKHPPESGDHVGDARAVEAVIQRNPPMYFSQFVFGDTITISARAVAKAVPTPLCVWALEPTNNGLTLAGTADVTLDCGVQVNSDAFDALESGGSSCMIADLIRVSGGASGSCFTPEPKVNMPPMTDPLARRAQPTWSGCDHTSKVSVKDGDPPLTPGVYCNGIQVNGGADVTLSAGTYYITGGSFKMSGGAALRGDDVTIFLGQDATVDITAATIELSAPETGPLNGILFFQDRDAPPSRQNKIAGNANVELEGALYFPTSHLDFAGVSTTAIPAPVMVANTLRFVGTTALGGNGADRATPMTTAQLVE